MAEPIKVPEAWASRPDEWKAHVESCSSCAHHYGGKPLVYPSLRYVAHLEADLVRAERAVVLLRNLVDVITTEYGCIDAELNAAERYLAELDAADTDMV